MTEDDTCQICKTEVETQDHIFLCPKTVEKVPELIELTLNKTINHGNNTTSRKKQN